MSLPPFILHEIVLKSAYRLYKTYEYLLRHISTSQYGLVPFQKQTLYILLGHILPFLTLYDVPCLHRKSQSILIFYKQSTLLLYRLYMKYPFQQMVPRSEERRVGKECIFWCGWYIF